MKPVRQISEAQLAHEFMCQYLLEYAEEFYKDPKNEAAFQEWLKTQEADNDSQAPTEKETKE